MHIANALSWGPNYWGNNPCLQTTQIIHNGKLCEIKKKQQNAWIVCILYLYTSGPWIYIYIYIYSYCFITYSYLISLYATSHCILYNGNNPIFQRSRVILAFIMATRVAPSLTTTLPAGMYVCILRNSVDILLFNTAVV